MNIVLASQSPRRKKILEDKGYNIIVDISHADEESIIADNIQNKVMKIAKLKADTVSKRHDDAIIIAVDTMVYFNNEEIGQQKNHETAILTLEKLAGKTHQVYSGICLMMIKNNRILKTLQDFEVSDVKIKAVSNKMIKEYVESGHYKGKAGAYNIGDKEFESFIEKVSGSYTNIMGLPLEKVEEMLKKIQS